MSAFLQDQRGNVLVMAGLLLPVLGIAIAAAVDFSDGNRTKANLQATADAAALAGARELVMASSYSGSTAARALASSVAWTFVNSRVAHATTEVSVPDANTVVVTISQNKPMFFGGLLGQDTMAVSASGTAVVVQTPAPCMLAVGPDEPIGIGLVGAAKIDAPKCTVQSNSTSATSIRLQGAPQIVAGKVCGSGGLPNGRTTPPAQHCGPGTDPLEAKWPNKKTIASSTPIYSGPCDFNNTSIGASAKGTTLLRPGIYCGGISIQSSDVVLESGLYTIQDGPLSLQGNATLTGDGVTILLSGAGAVVDLQGSPSITLTAMQTGSYPNMALVSSTPAVPILVSTLQGSPTLTVSGSIDMPTQRLVLQGHPSLNILGKTDSLVALSFALQGSPEIAIKADNTSMQPSGIRLSR